MKRIMILTSIFSLLFIDYKALCLLAALLLLGAIAVVGFAVFKYGDRLGL